MKDIDNMTKRDFRKVKPWKDHNKIIECDSIVILPGDRFHIDETGYRYMSFIAVKDNQAICSIGRGCDVIRFPDVGLKGWSIDCLKKSGYLHIFCTSKIKIIPGLSVVEILITESKYPA